MSIKTLIRKAREANWEALEYRRLGISAFAADAISFRDYCVRTARGMKPVIGATDMSETYYTLVVRENGVWHPQFGDFDREVVDQERIDCYLSNPYKASDILVILCTPDDQKSIDFAVNVLNGRFAVKEA